MVVGVWVPKGGRSRGGVYRYHSIDRLPILWLLHFQYISLALQFFRNLFCDNIP